MSLEAVAADPSLRLRALTRVQYEHLVEAGLLEGERLELLCGLLVGRDPQPPVDARVITELNHHLVRRLPDPWWVSVLAPLAVGPTSEPEPDIAVVQRSRGRHPSTGALVIEVSGTTQRTDLVHKPPVYAAAGVEQYWVLDLPRREVVVHTEPENAGYATVRRLPWTAPLEVLGVSVDLAALLADL